MMISFNYNLFNGLNYKYWKDNQPILVANKNQTIVGKLLSDNPININNWFDIPHTDVYPKIVSILPSRSVLHCHKGWVFFVLIDPTLEESAVKWWK